MSDLVFGRIEIRKMPGFESGGFAVEQAQLCPGVNLIFGPNAVGKTTLAQSIQALLWPIDEAPPGASLCGAFGEAGSEWLVDIDAGQVRYQRDGTAVVAPPLLPPSDAADRYMLALHDLLKVETTGDQFARLIQREMAGGYDLARAAKELGFVEKPPQPRNLRQKLLQVRGHLRDSQRKQDELRADEDRLQDLRTQRGTSAEAREQVDLLKLAIEHAAAAADVAQARSALSALPSAIENIAGNELEQVHQLRRDVEQAEQQRRDADRDLDEANHKIKACDLPADGVSEALIDEVRAKVRSLRSLEQIIQSAEQNVAGAKSRRDDALRAVGCAADSADPSALDEDAVSRIADLARRAEAAHAEMAACDAMRKWLVEAREPPDLQKIQAGVNVLTRWLRSGTDESERMLRSFRWVGVAGGALTALSGAVLAGSVHWLWLLAAVAGIALVVAALRRRDLTSARRVYRDEYETLGLDRPDSWSDEAVERRLDDLLRQRAETVVAKERLDRWNDLEDKRQGLEIKAKELSEGRRRLTDAIGVAPDIEEPRLLWLIKHLIDWRRAARECESLTERLNEAERQRVALAKEISDLISPYGCAAASGADGADAQVEGLDRRRQRFEQAFQKRSDATRRREDAARTIQQKEERRRNLVGRVGLDPDAPDTEAKLDEYCRQRGTYVEAKSHLHVAEVRRCDAEQRLTSHSRFDERLKQEAIASLKNELTDAENRASRYDELNREIAGIEARVEVAKRANDIEAALAECDRAQQDLLDKFDDDCTVACGWVLAEYLRREMAERDLPRVFQRARELFAHITGDSYRLELERDGDPPRFRAVETATGRGRALDELSSGTRVQLLLAVRLAFVETLEGGAALPLILDEVLANSDDERAPKIIEATVALSRRGRQVFVFSAQRDEVAKWGAILRDHPDVPHRCTDLAYVRGLASTPVSVEP